MNKEVQEMSDVVINNVQHWFKNHRASRNPFIEEYDSSRLRVVNSITLHKPIFGIVKELAYYIYDLKSYDEYKKFYSELIYQNYVKTDKD